ncbi:MAG: oligosaccharyl transferase, archaeosortase A system-associated, partial [Dehalococcoidia bacterium]|nr:oligosaccharyl transferase, archaeosortase A system-associated [Dehalococcoidia bacterium]
MSTLPAKIRARLSRRAIYSIILLIIFGIALALRVCLPYEDVFTGDSVRFGGNDPWYHMRLVENLVQHFPHLIAFDPFTLYPYGQAVPFAPFFDLLLGFFIWVIALGSPTQHTIETVGAYFPAILGALVTIPVYFIGRELFNRTVGLLSAGLIAILPGQFLLRSLLGFADHHIAEVLFSATAALFLILAIKRARGRGTSFGHIRSRDWGNLRKPLIYALLAGLALGIYLISWSGGLLFVFIIFAYMIVQYIIDHLRGKSTDYLCIIGVPMFL